MIRDQVKLRPQWREAIIRAEAQGDKKILLSSLTPAEECLATELWAVLGTKLGGTAWEFRRNIEDGNGLDLWRAVNHEYDRKTPGRAAAIEKQLLNLEPMKGPQEASKTIETIEHGTRLHNSMAIVHILEQDMHSFLWRTVPKEFVQLMLQLGNSVSTYPELKERLLN